MLKVVICRWKFFPCPNPRFFSGKTAKAAQGGGRKAAGRVARSGRDGPATGRGAGGMNVFCRDPASACRFLPGIRAGSPPGGGQGVRGAGPSTPPTTPYTPCPRHEKRHCRLTCPPAAARHMAFALPLSRHAGRASRRRRSFRAMRGDLLRAVPRWNNLPTQAPRRRHSVARPKPSGKTTFFPQNAKPA